MSINDPILEALAFTLENDLDILTRPPGSGRVTATSAVPQDSVSNNREPPSSTEASVRNDSEKVNFVKSSAILEEEVDTLCPIPTCGYIRSTSGQSSGSLSCESKSKAEEGEFLAHLLTEHQLVIEKPQEIANFAKYFRYWRQRFESFPLSHFCVGFRTEEPPKPQETKGAKPPVAENEGDESSVSGDKQGSVSTPASPMYYMLSTDLPEDDKIRKELWKRRIDIVLEVNRQEREATDFSHRCLFCREIISGNRSHYFSHMREKHSFHIGLPDNLVFVSELLHVIDVKLNRLECLFCEHIFKDKVVLREHMRKKQHRQINPKNREYDRFYVVNYLEPGKTWQNFELEDAEDERKEDEWTEVSGEKERTVVCLFCKTSDPDFDVILGHMKTSHNFDFASSTTLLDFYQKVKLVNYIRRTVYQNTCLSCQERFTEQDALVQHIAEHNLNGSFDMLPSADQWNQPEYYFPTYESDDFLTFLDMNPQDVDGTDSSAVTSEDENVVIPEDLPHIERNQDFDLAGFAIRYHNQRQ